MTPPLRGPNATDIQGSHFRNADNTGPNRGELNLPGKVRRFIFSPEVPDLWVERDRWPTPEDIQRVAAFGRGN